MEKIVIAIRTTNAAFDDQPHEEVARILTELAEKLRRGREPEKLLDINGNAVGIVEYFED